MRLDRFNKHELFIEGSHIGVGQKVTFCQAVCESKWSWVVTLTKRWLTEV